MVTKEFRQPFLEVLNPIQHAQQEGRNVNLWDRMDDTEQKTVKTEADEVREALKTEGNSKLSIGEHLTRIREILEPKRIFVAFLKDQFSMSKSTAYRYMDLYAAAHTKLPKAVLDVAIQHNMPIKLELVKQKPAPKTSDTKQIMEYLSTLRPTRIEVAASPESLLKECVAFCSTRWERLPRNSKVRREFMEKLIGMLMSKFGVASQISFSPMAVPESFAVKRGRPKAA